MCATYEQPPPYDPSDYGDPYKPNMNSVVQKYAPAPRMGSWDILNAVSGFTVTQVIDTFEVVTNCQQPNRYLIQDQNGANIFFAGEQSGFCIRQVCNSLRGFLMHITNMTDGTPFLLLERPYKFTCMCCNLQRIIVRDPNNNNEVLGTIWEEFSCCGPRFRLDDEQGRTVYRGAGHLCVCTNCICQEYSLNLSGVEGNNIGAITNHYAGCCRMMMTSADVYSVHFPPSAHARHKALILGACILMDMLHFEKQPGQDG